MSVPLVFPTAMPSPRVPDPMAAPPLRWGVLGTGWIAQRFSAALHRHTRQRVVAVGSRSVISAREFADRIGAQRAHGSYADLAADPEVDVVYVATPHNHHRAHALLALDAGRHVLIEKPIALNAAEAQEIADRAATRGVYCAEALWTFCLPRYDVIRQLLDDGVLGDVHTVLADNGERLPATHRIYRHDLAGGPGRARGRGQRTGVDPDAAHRRRPVHDQHHDHGRHPYPGRARRHPSHAGRRRALLHPRHPHACLCRERTDLALDRTVDRS
jgi:hypothetical protein